MSLEVLDVMGKKRALKRSREVLLLMKAATEREATHRKVYCAGAGVTWDAGTETPYCLQVIKQFAVCAHGLEKKKKKKKKAANMREQLSENES